MSYRVLRFVLFALALTLTALVADRPARAVLCHQGDTELVPDECCTLAFTVQRVREYDCVNGLWRATTKVMCTPDACIGE